MSDPTFPPADPAVPEAVELAALLRARMARVRPTGGLATVADRVSGLVTARRPVYATVRQLSAAQLDWLADYARAETSLRRTARQLAQDARRRRPEE